jgi:hypothetical protein
MQSDQSLAVFRYNVYIRHHAFVIRVEIDAASSGIVHADADSHIVNTAIEILRDAVAGMDHIFRFVADRPGAIFKPDDGAFAALPLEACALS